MARLCEKCYHNGCCADLHFCGGRWFVPDCPEPDVEEGEDGEESEECEEEKK